MLLPPPALPLEYLVLYLGIVKGPLSVESKDLPATKTINCGTTASWLADISSWLLKKNNKRRRRFCKPLLVREKVYLNFTGN